MKNKLLILLILFSGFCFSQKNTPPLPLIPLPSEIIHQPGKFKLSGNTKFYTQDARLARELMHLNTYLKTNNGFSIERTDKKNQENVIILENVWPNNSSAEKTHEWYTLNISENNITINGDSTGVFYGIQTLIH
jgi:N-acetyl-beta-hexosaminidase